MAKGNDTVGKTLLVATLLCVACSVAVSTTAVVLKPQQEHNQRVDRRKNILAAADLMKPGKSVAEIFDERVETRLVNLQSGEFTRRLDPESYQQRKAAADPELSRKLSAQEDLADIGRRERYSKVYLVREDNGDLAKIVLPVRGYGLWSTMYGFLALESDANTVAGLYFYDQEETPGLGAKVASPRWRELWPGKKIYNDQGEPAVDLVKGGVSKDTPNREHKVDALSGATLTSRGVENLLRFWLGENGFKPFLAKMRDGQEGV